KVAHVAGEYGVELRQQFGTAACHGQSRLFRLPDLIAHFTIEAVPDAQGERQDHRHLVLLARQPIESPADMAQLDVTAIASGNASWLTPEALGEHRVDR